VVTEGKRMQCVDLLVTHRRPDRYFRLAHGYEHIAEPVSDPRQEPASTGTGLRHTVWMPQTSFQVTARIREALT
jgi:hypothetical protein